MCGWGAKVFVRHGPLGVANLAGERSRIDEWRPPARRIFAVFVLACQKIEHLGEKVLGVLFRLVRYEVYDGGYPLVQMHSGARAA